jgi:hypothetical protein
MGAWNLAGTNAGTVGNWKERRKREGKNIIQGHLSQ